MTHEEVRYILNDLEDEFDKHDERSIIAEALRMAIDAHEKQIPKKPSDNGIIGVSIKVGACPLCSQVNNYAMNYCSHCGQALDWSDTE